MITEIPTAGEFHNAGINLLYLAWQIAMQATHDFEQAEELAYGLTEEEASAARTAFWTKSQPALANAFSLVQQSMEMGLKGKIAAISPFLLISRDPKDWPKGADTGQVPFSDFRTLDAADLVKVHNTFADNPIDDAFRIFWDGVRRQRNVLMHSVSTQAYDPAVLVRHVLLAVEALFNEVRWPQRLFAMEADGKYAGFGLSGDGDHNVVMGQVDVAIRHLTTADAKRFFGFDTRRRAYLCPGCWGRADRDWQDEWPKLAQLQTKVAAETRLRCVVCDDVSEIERAPCTQPDCRGNVLSDGACLTCTTSQDSPDNFDSGLQRPNASSSVSQYHFTFHRGNRSAAAYGYFPCEADAIEHARLALLAPHLQEWSSAEVWGLSGIAHRTLGAWVRDGAKLIWDPHFKWSIPT